MLPAQRAAADELADRAAGEPASSAIAVGASTTSSREAPAHPIITGEDAIELTGRSGTAARGALNQLTDDGVLAEVTLAKRNRAWESIGLFALVDELERDLSGGAISAAATR